MTLTLSVNKLVLTWATTIENIAEFHLLVANTTDRTPIVKIEIYDPTARSYTLDATLLIPGKVFVVSIQATDVNGAVVTSNIVNPDAPLGTPAPAISSIIGLDNALQVNVTYPTLASYDTLLTGSPQIVFIVLDTTGPNKYVTVKRPSGLAQYTLSKADDANIENFQTFEVCCYMMPDSADTKHKNPSAISNTVIATCSNQAGAPYLVPTLSDFNQDNSSYPLKIQWQSPADESTWTGNSSKLVEIFVKKASDSNFPDIPTNTLDLNKGYNVGYLAQVVNAKAADAAPRGYYFQEYQLTGVFEPSAWQIKIRYRIDSRAGAFSEVVSWNNQYIDQPLNLSAIVDPATSVINFSWKANPAWTSYPTAVGSNYQVQLIGSEPENVLGATSFSKSFTASDIGKTLQFRVRLTYTSVNSHANWYGQFGNFSDVVPYVLPGPVTNSSAVAGDQQITVSWSPPSATDGNTHTDNAARVVVTLEGDGNSFTNTTDASNGTYVISNLVNGNKYTVDIFSIATSPISTTVISTQKVSFQHVAPIGSPPTPTGVVAVAGSSQITYSWNEHVGEVKNGATIASFAYTLNGQSFTTLSNPLVVTGLSDGTQYSFTLSEVSTGGVSSAFTDAVLATPTGSASISNVVLSGTTVTCSFAPHGNKILAWEVVGLPAQLQIGDYPLIVSTPTNVSPYTNNVTGTIPLMFSFTQLSSNLANVIILIQTSAGTAVYNSFTA